MHDLPDEASRVAADSLLAKLGIAVANVEGITVWHSSLLSYRSTPAFTRAAYPFSGLSLEQIRQLQARFGKRK